ncbi:hypothetical protein BYT27DRAFT_7191766 [Phlegmacium glaucopus]|nr:hypothetical protein BYT27DRAFT_7191766 [Phlegmacium glaucopus]
MRYLNCRDELEAGPVWFKEKAMKYETCYPRRNLELLHDDSTISCCPSPLQEATPLEIISGRELWTI